MLFAPKLAFDSLGAMHWLQLASVSISAISERFWGATKDESDGEKYIKHMR